MNINRIDNRELRNFIEKKPEATFKDIIDFCMQKFDDAMAELDSSDTKRLQRELNNDNLNSSPSKFKDIIQPFVRENQNRPYYNRLQDRAMQMTKKVMKDVETLKDTHSAEFINSLKKVVHDEFDDIRMITPNRRTDLNSIYKDTNRSMQSRKETQDSNDKKKTNNISNDASHEQESIMNDFVELSTAEQQNYGFTFEGGRGSRRVVPIKRVFDGVKAKIEQLASLFKSTKNFLNYDMIGTLTHDNARILEEVQSTVRECRNIIDEAVYQISKEQIEEELRRDDQRREDIRKKLEEEDRALEAKRAERKKEEEQYMARAQAKHKSELYSNDSGTSEDFSDIDLQFDKDIVLIDPSPETYQILIEAGMPRDSVPKYIWDRFVRSSNLDRKLKNGEITQKEYDQQAKLIDRIEELLFDNLVEGKSIDVARAVAENMAVRESTVAIVPSPKTQKALEEAGLSSEDAKRYVWDRYVRIQLINEAHLNGQITEAEKAEQIAKVDEIEAELADGLKSGKSFENARRNAEISARKHAMLDIVENGNITMSQVQKANDFMQAEVNPQVKETKKILTIIYYINTNKRGKLW